MRRREAGAGAGTRNAAGSGVAPCMAGAGAALSWRQGEARTTAALCAPCIDCSWRSRLLAWLFSRLQRVGKREMAAGRGACWAERGASGCRRAHTLACITLH